MGVLFGDVAEPSGQLRDAIAVPDEQDRAGVPAATSASRSCWSPVA